MDQYGLGDKGALPSEPHLPLFSESQGLTCSDSLNRNLGPSTRDLLSLGGLELDPKLSAPDVPSEVLEDNLDTLSLSSGRDNDFGKLLEEYTDLESQTSVQDQGPGAVRVSREAEEGGRATLGSARKGKRQHSSPQSALLDCSLCGKVFSSASSLSKHYLTHSQERKHICKICSKAFKRQDHLTGHMLTHQKTKPFVCIEQGCSKSYCDYRSLRRHYEVQHGLCILKEAPPEEDTCGDSPHTPDTASQPLPSSLRSLGPPEARSPGSVLPNRDLLRCIVSTLVHQKIPSPGPATVGAPDGEGRNTSCPCTTSPGPSSCIPGILGTEVPEEPHPPQKELAADVSPAENGDPDPPESEPLLLQLPSSLEDWPKGGTLATSLAPFRGQKVPTSSQPSSHSLQWFRNLPSCPKSKGNNVLTVHKAPGEGSESGPGPSGTSAPAEPSPSTGDSQDAPPLLPTLLKVPSEASGDPGPDTGDKDSWASKKSESFPSDAMPLFRQLFLKSQESLVSREQMQVFQMVTKSQRIFSHTQVTAPASQPSGPEGKQTVLKSLQGPWPQQSRPQAPAVDSLQGPRNMEPEGSPAHRRKPAPTVPREASPNGTRRDTKGAPKVASAPPSLTTPPLDPSRNPDISSLAKQLQSSKGTLDLGNIFSPEDPRQAQADGDELPSTQLSENGPACTRGGGCRLFSGHPRAQRFSGFRKEKVRMDVCCAASPSQVAMASFSSTGPPADPARDVKSKLTIFNRIQGGNIYRLPHPIKEESMAGRCNQPNGSPTDCTEPRSTFVCKNCSQMFYTEKGLSSHMCFHSDQWPSPQGNQEQQVFATESCKPPRQALRPDRDGQSPSEAKKPLEHTATAPLGIPVPVALAPCPPGSVAKGQEKDGEERDDEDSSKHRKRKKHLQPQALFVPPPPCAFGDPGPGGGHQGCLRSPVFLVDHLLKGLFRCSPYTPPPMLSPIREGSGLHFSMLCSKSQAGPHQLISSALDQVDGSFSICVVKDDSKISIEPHINIGSRFQAEIPELQERSLARPDEHRASLVWKPWGDVMTNPETQDRVTELCNVACSSVMPGGGTNLELALHCLHEAQGSIQVALEMLLLRGAQKPRTHPLANYRYTGSDIWTPMEKRLFKKAFCAHKKDFYLIHKMIQTKTVAQCVEYYYIWKKMIKFDCGRASGLEKRVKRELDEVERTEEKVTCSPQERPGHSPTPELKIKTKSYRRESILNASPSAAPKRTPEPPGSVESQGVFPCRECERVFDKIKSRNAHMKRHRLQEHSEPVLRVKWPVKPFPLKEEEAEEEEELGTDISPLQW
ncbi:zinc finger protein 541 isoform X1 [Fukomys damarensis]|uniref:zinc finger protein 541 isoform X1 n=1 Tax=Fukomys damarensis TaxID=885580 RepID=UPI00054029D4|nr:zinc finger protein 541 isoform X1 [Fukomys damarensis]XP_010639119.1 zinc finger protein 541 isoform X1 [Fukomys damarensis]XP_010639120.1 zinc finger protein 541 isoform X1 [Fukomys damarensis]XP_010639121.1 zinc finger protein 541 isoform X1 [Fukomys damarensis]XP_010639122.1 zinc finger protein 541 isoform X1 [Fukomys damarensis]XP_010639123.1 zinc finger protein 541 isoform X1 [Fukomys damarensis]XP_010639124.1 zinc finger protein 541 isoform X1 [Fukomys damarensis]XP_010639125.1 zin